MSTKKSQMLVIGQQMGSTEWYSHQYIHCRRFEDIVFEEFVSNADMNKSIVFCEKPLASYRVLRFWMRISTNLGCGVELVDELETVREMSETGEVLEEQPAGLEEEGTTGLIPKEELTGLLWLSRG